MNKTFVYYTFLAGAAALAALPFVTAGFFSKDPILWYAWSSIKGNPFLWVIALSGAFITAFYCTRLILVVFFGEMKTPVHVQPGNVMTVPLVILAILSLIAGFIEWPHNLIHLSLFSDFIQDVLPAPVLKEGLPPELIFQLIAAVVTFAGIYAGYAIYQVKNTVTGQWLQSDENAGIRNFLYNGWGFDRLYETIFVKPFVFITSVNKSDGFDRIYNGIAQVNLKLNRLLSVSQNGSLRLYIGGFIIGILFIITLQLIL
jgi:NADH-quinone oxidoreductase subunit L